MDSPSQDPAVVPGLQHYAHQEQGAGGCPPHKPLTVLHALHAPDQMAPHFLPLGVTPTPAESPLTFARRSVSLSREASLTPGEHLLSSELRERLSVPLLALALLLL